MRKVIGIGEIILDIIFKEDQPHAAVPGGSVFNGMVSLSRLGIPVSFIGEVGMDRIGKIITDFMQANNMSTEYIDSFSHSRTPVALAFLNESKNADFVFYTNDPVSRLNTTLPVINRDDILVFGSFYALNPLLRERITELLEYAKYRKAIIYYDLNFRKSHAHDAIRVRSSVIENFEYTDIVRGSDEDFINLYGNKNLELVYEEEIRFYCRNFIMTQGSKGINLYTEKLRFHSEVPQLMPVSTIGAGDNFNAGIIYGLLKHNVGYDDIHSIDEATWRKIICCGIDFSTEVCRSFSNSLSPEFAKAYKVH